MPNSLPLSLSAAQLSSFRNSVTGSNISVNESGMVSLTNLTASLLFRGKGIIWKADGIVKPKYEKKKARRIDNILCSCAIPVQRYGIVDGVKKKMGTRDFSISSWGAGLQDIVSGPRAPNHRLHGHWVSGRRTPKAY